MRVYVLLLFVVGCWGIQWKAMHDFKNFFEAYATASANTISHIQNILDASRTDSEIFLNNTYSNNPVVKRITRMKLSNNNKCFTRFIDEDNLKFMFENQIYQLQIPLRRRLVEIRERLNKINSSIDIYERVAESIFRGCKSLQGNCFEETNEWLRSTIYSLSCAIHPRCLIIHNPTNHSIRKRTICHSRDFMCEYGKCITGNVYCDGECDCEDCSDERKDCIKDCPGFRCIETFWCIPNSKKCNGIDDCGDGTDEEGCRHSTTNKPSFRTIDCSIDAGQFFCRNTKCISLEQACDGFDDCGDMSDEGAHCNDRQCSPECGRKGGVCFRGSKGSKCLYECPPGTYETSQGCNEAPEAPLTTLAQFLDDTPRLTTRYGARFKFLKNKTVRTIYKSLEVVVKCKKQGFGSPIENGYENIGTGSVDTSKQPFQTSNKRQLLTFEIKDYDNMTGRISGESGGDENQSKTSPSLNTKTNPTNQDHMIIIDDDNLPGRLSGESGGDENQAKTRPSSNTKTNPTNQDHKIIVDDDNLAGRLIGESGSDENQAKTKPSSNTKTNSTNQDHKIILDDDNLAGRLSGESGGDENQSKTSPSLNTKTNPTNQDHMIIIDDDNLPGRLSGESGGDENQAKTRPSSNTKTNPTNQDHKIIVDDDNLAGRLIGESGGDENQAKTKPSSNTKTNSTNQDHIIILDDDNLAGRLSGESGGDENQAKTRPSSNTKTNPTNQDHKIIVDDDNMAGRLSGESGGDENQAKTKPSSNTKTNSTNQDHIIIVDDDNLAGRLIGESGGDENQAKTKPSSNTKTNPTNQDHIIIVDDDNLPGRLSGESGGDENQGKIRPSSNNKKPLTNQDSAIILDENYIVGRPNHIQDDVVIGSA